MSDATSAEDVNLVRRSARDLYRACSRGPEELSKLKDDVGRFLDAFEDVHHNLPSRPGVDKVLDAIRSTFVQVDAFLERTLPSPDRLGPSAEPMALVARPHVLDVEVESYRKQFNVHAQLVLALDQAKTLHDVEVVREHSLDLLRMTQGARYAASRSSSARRHSPPEAATQSTPISTQPGRGLGISPPLDPSRAAPPTSPLPVPPPVDDLPSWNELSQSIYDHLDQLTRKRPSIDDEEGEIVIANMVTAGPSPEIPYVNIMPGERFIHAQAPEPLRTVPKSPQTVASSMLLPSSTSPGTISPVTPMSPLDHDPVTWAMPSPALTASSGHSSAHYSEMTRLVEADLTQLPPFIPLMPPGHETPPMDLAPLSLGDPAGETGEDEDGNVPELIKGSFMSRKPVLAWKRIPGNTVVTGVPLRRCRLCQAQCMLTVDYAVSKESALLIRFKCLRTGETRFRQQFPASSHERPVPCVESRQGKYKVPPTVYFRRSDWRSRYSVVKNQDGPPMAELLPMYRFGNDTDCNSFQTLIYGRSVRAVYDVRRVEAETKKEKYKLCGDDTIRITSRKDFYGTVLFVLITPPSTSSEMPSLIEDPTTDFESLDKHDKMSDSVLRLRYAKDKDGSSTLRENRASANTVLTRSPFPSGVSNPSTVSTSPASLTGSSQQTLIDPGSPGSRHGGVTMSTGVPLPDSLARRNSVGSKLSAEGNTLKSLRIQFYTDRDREAFIMRWKEAFK